MKDDKWKSIQEEPPEVKLDSFGRNRQILLGKHGVCHHLFDIAYVNYEKNIIKMNSQLDADLSLWTHWREIPEVPE